MSQKKLPLQQSVEEKPCLHCKQLTSYSNQFCCSGCEFLYHSHWKLSSADLFDNKNSPYDQPEVKIRYQIQLPGNAPAYRLHLEGLQCSSCVHALEDIPQYFSQIISARVNFPRSEIYIEATPDHSLSQILNFFEKMGYPAKLLLPEEVETQHRLKEERDLLSRLAVAGACAGNIMLLAVSIYGGLEGSLEFVFQALCFVLFLPILFYSAVPLYRSAWSSLQFRRINMDFPLVVAMWIGFGASTFNLIRGNGHIYFDSTAGFIFLILVSRWFLRNSLRRWTQNFFDLDQWSDGVFQVQRQQKSLSLLVSEILPGDLLSLGSQKVVPADGILKVPSALFDFSWMTGESIPRRLHQDMAVPAGARVLSDRCEIEATTSGSQSELAKSLRRVETESLSQSQSIHFFDRAARRLLIVVFATAGLLILLSPFLGLTLEEAFERALSLFIVACPCALAFGGPLAYGLAVKKAAREGIIVKSADVFDRINECQTIAFDKTGTLTEGQLKLVKQTPELIPDWMKQVILSLEQQSLHPIAFAFRSLWPHINVMKMEALSIGNDRETKIFGTCFGHLYTLQAGPTDKGNLSIQFLQDDQLLAFFDFEDTLRMEASALLRHLSKKYSLGILSGDRQDRVQSIAEQISAPFSFLKGNCTAQEKSDWISRHPNTLMLGDGVNDLEALSKAHVGVVVQGPLVHGLRAGSVYFLKPGLKPLEDLLSLSQATKRLIARNLFFALSYNLTAGLAALLGWINPLLAALLMPISSLLLVASTWRASK